LNTETYSVLTDFPGASLGLFNIVGNQISAELRREAVLPADGFLHDYNRHFCFGLRNHSEVYLDLEVSINGGTQDLLSGKDILLFTSGDLVDDFEQTSLEGATDYSRSHWFEIGVPAGETVYVANYMFRPPEILERRLDRLAELGAALRIVYGQTVEGRPLVSYSYDKGDLPWILITSGFHPTEADSLGTEAVMDLLASNEKLNLLASFNVLIVPIVNPDGFYRGFNACNAHEINFYWTFLEEDRKVCPEAYHLWRLIKRHEPVLYFDFHAYTFQGPGKHPGPYLKPLVFYRTQRLRKVVRRITEKLLKGSNGHGMWGVLTYTPSTLASKITKRFNTITYAKYHLRLRDGAAYNKQRAADVVLEAANILREEFKDPRCLLTSRLGLRRHDPIRAIGSRMTEFWGLKIKPVLRRQKRRMFS